MYGTVCGRVGSGAALILDEEYGRLRRACEEGQHRKLRLAFSAFTHMKHSGAE